MYIVLYSNPKERNMLSLFSRLGSTVYVFGGYYTTIWWLTPVRQWAGTPVVTEGWNSFATKSHDLS